MFGLRVLSMRGVGPALDGVVVTNHKCVGGSEGVREFSLDKVNGHKSQACEREQRYLVC